MKSIGDLELADFDDHVIWESALNGPDGCDDEAVRPVSGKSTVADGDSNLWVRFVGTLADGTGIAGIAFAESPPPTLSNWSFLFEGTWLVLHLKPAPPFVLAKTGPEPFAKALHRTLAQVFPIKISSEIVAEATGQPITATINP
jgi:hypothetical protein